MNKSKKDLIKISLLFLSLVAVFYIGEYSLAYSHELINQGLFKAYGINSTIVLFFPERIITDSWIVPNAPEYALSATEPNVIQFQALETNNPKAFETLIGQIEQNESLTTQKKQIADNLAILVIGYTFFFIIIAWKDDFKNKIEGIK